MIPFGASLHGYNWKAVSEATSSPGGGESLTQQHFAEEVDINTIVRRFGLTPAGFPDSMLAGVYGDFTGITDFESAVGTIERTRDRFMMLPADVREKFGNDPGKLVEFAGTHTQEEWDAILKRPEEPVVPPAA